MQSTAYQGVIIAAVLGLTAFSLASAATPKDITYPVPELNNCESEAACRAYCDLPENQSQCVEAAQKYKLISDAEAERMKRFMQIIESGGPGGCTNATACEAYCGLPAHGRECFDFGRRHGLISNEESAQVDKFLKIMERGEAPGGCAEETACREYCSLPTHVEECINFAVNAGLVTKSEAGKLRQFAGKGPGGCTSAETCATFCNTPANQEICFMYAREHHLIPEDQLNEVKRGVHVIQNGLDQAPPQAVACVKKMVGAETMERMRKGEVPFDPSLGEKVQGCFAPFMQQMPRASSPAMPPAIGEECVRELYGAESVGKMMRGEMMPPPDMAQKVSACVKSKLP